MAGLRALAQELRWPGVSALQSIAPLYKKNWRVYLKRPFGGPEQVLAYLANYTHRVAIANSRIRQIDEATGKVTITYRDYADGAEIKLLKLSGIEFIRRFSLHLLPPRFTKIQHCGILGNNRKARLRLSPDGIPTKPFFTLATKLSSFLSVNAHEQRTQRPCARIIAADDELSCSRFVRA